jgi:hypothetical protein
MAKPTTPADIEDDQKIDRVLMERLAKIIGVLPDIEN